MTRTLVDKILAARILEGEPSPGGEVALRVDQVLLQDGTGVMAFLQFEALGVERIKADLAVTYVDHKLTQTGFENADDQAYLQSVSARFGAVFSRAGNGVCHVVHMERFGRPGTTLLGCDSHTPTAGALGQLALGAGGLDVAVAMAGGPFRLVYPRTWLVRLTGRLQGWASAKDAALAVLDRLGVRGNVGVALEYGGDGLASLSVPERATLANLGAEAGVTTSVFPSDETTRRFLRAQGREEDWRPLAAEAGAVYERTVEIDLGSVEPLAAAPPSPGRVVRVADLAGLKVDQVCLGSCTNASYTDLLLAATILRGKRVHPRVSLGVAPGSRQVLRMLARQGALEDLVAAGARLLEPGCGFCIGANFAPPSDGVSVRTSNRNFPGRSGAPDAQVYLAGPAVAALAALTGELTPPDAFGPACPRPAEPEAYLPDDALLIFPSAGLRETPIRRGPTIGPPPRGAALPSALAGEVVIKLGDNVTTDDIIPAGERLRYRSNIPKSAGFVFEGVDPSFPGRCLANQGQGIHNLIVAGESYGQGSSREVAALCPMHLGVKAVLAKSFERIHAANLANFGLVPLVFDDPADYDRLAPGDRLSAPDWRAELAAGRPIRLHLARTGQGMEFLCPLSAGQREDILAGGRLNRLTGAGPSAASQT